MDTLKKFPDRAPNLPRGVRFAHLLVDYFMISILFGVINAFIQEEMIVYAVLILYYVLMEGMFSGTIAKLMMGNVVVDEFGQRIGFKKALIRTLCRFVPLEPFSIFFHADRRTWHDKWANTYVIDKKDLKTIKELLEGSEFETFGKEVEDQNFEEMV